MSGAGTEDIYKRLARLEREIWELRRMLTGPHDPVGQLYHRDEHREPDPITVDS